MLFRRHFSFFQIKCKNGIGGVIFKAITDGTISSSDQATSEISQDKVVNENRYANMLRKPREKSFPKGINIHLLPTVHIDTTEEASKKCKPDTKRNKEEQEGGEIIPLQDMGVEKKRKDDYNKSEEETALNEITPLLDNGDHIGIPKSASEHIVRERIVQGEESRDHGNLGLRFSSAGEITQRKDFSVELQPDATVDIGLNKMKVGNVESEDEKGKKDEVTELAEEEKHSTLIQDARGVLTSKESTRPNKVEQQEVETGIPQDEVEQAADFLIKDVLCFAWQVAKGMVSDQIKGHVGSMK